MNQAPAIMWFRQDLRLQDNPALLDIIQHGKVLPVYILDESSAAEWTPGAASRWWLHASLSKLNQALGGNLWVLRGEAHKVLPEFAMQQGASIVTWNRCYEPWQISSDDRTAKKLRELGIGVKSCNGALLFEPGTIVKADGTPYKIFSPFYKRAMAIGLPRARPLIDIKRELRLVDCLQSSDKLDILQLLPEHSWHENLRELWEPGEAGAAEQLQRFLNMGLVNYQKGRDFPALGSVSRLSPALHFGELSPRQVLTEVRQIAEMDGVENQAEHFCRELLWREFSHSLLVHFPTLTNRNMKPHFDGFAWRSDPTGLKRWQQGQTGFPLVDAGMRELWQTGYMHNRVRMIVASFLVKNLMIHWREGARWFWDCLLDADLANNSCSWQWVAGSGTDAAPYFRIFNPVTQSKKFDAEGRYIKYYIPELAELSAKHIHDPSSAPEIELQRAGITLDETYPRAIVDLKQSRAQALDAYQNLAR